MNNYKELQSMQPEFYIEVVEMQEILKAHGYGLDNAENNINKLKDNILLASINDIEVIERLELFLKIPRDTNKTNQQRVQFIIAKLRSRKKLSKTVIQAMADAFGEKADVEFKNSTIYIHFIDSMGIPPGLYSFEQIIQQMKPEHLAYGVTIRIRQGSKINIASVMRSGSIETIYPKLIKSIESGGKIVQAITHINEIENIYVYPYNIKSINTRGKINIPIIPNNSIENINIYPKEVI